MEMNREFVVTCAVTGAGIRLEAPRRAGHAGTDC
ncbi:MAG: hypothetical protein CM1200mP18_11980 [Gammaproteobacteria bacterium]|nr:MAG: hypothetical protein CM1200mP18_11980 [Gammaproteobacteria bacterium]